MSILQAVRQYSMQELDDQETIPPSIWVAGHTLFYRAAAEDATPQPSTSKSVLIVSSTEHTPVVAEAAAPVTMPTAAAATSSTPAASTRKTRSSRLKGVKEKPEKRAKDTRKDRSFFSGKFEQVFEVMRRSSLAEGKVPPLAQQLEQYLSESLTYSLDDPSEKGLVLLRILYGLNTYWWWVSACE